MVRKDFFFAYPFSNMKKVDYHFSYQEFASSEDLEAEDANLLKQARNITQSAYAVYSKFRVGAAALLKNGQIVKGTNQENASYPVGICAERTLLSAAATLFPEEPILTMAISYDNRNEPHSSDHPIAPCGMCRQALQEFEERTQHPVRLLLAGMEGPVLIIESSSQLLPLAFKGHELNK